MAELDGEVSRVREYGMTAGDSSSVGPSQSSNGTSWAPVDTDLDTRFVVQYAAATGDRIHGSSAAITEVERFGMRSSRADGVNLDRGGRRIWRIIDSPFFSRPISVSTATTSS